MNDVCYTMAAYLDTLLQNFIRYKIFKRSFQPFKFDKRRIEKHICLIKHKGIDKRIERKDKINRVSFLAILERVTKDDYSL